MEWSDIRQALRNLRTCCSSPIALGLTLHEAGRKLAERHGLRCDDALILAAARKAKCRIVHSADMRDGQVIEGDLTISTPF